MPVDMSKYLGLFVSEGTEHLEALSRDLIRLERELDASIIDSMFRHAHSIKGMASSMGFEAMAVLSHRMEDLVDTIRSDTSRVDKSLVDLLLTTTDHLLVQIKA